MALFSTQAALYYSKYSGFRKGSSKLASTRWGSGSGVIIQCIKLVMAKR